MSLFWGERGLNSSQFEAVTGLGGIKQLSLRRHGCLPKRTPDGERSLLTAAHCVSSAFVDTLNGLGFAYAEAWLFWLGQGAPLLSRRFDMAEGDKLTPVRLFFWRDREVWKSDMAQDNGTEIPATLYAALRSAEKAGCIVSQMLFDSMVDEIERRIRIVAPVSRAVLGPPALQSFRRLVAA